MMVRGLKNALFKEKGAAPTTTTTTSATSTTGDGKLTEEQEMNALRAQFGLKPLGQAKK